MTKQWTLARFAAGLVLAWGGACGGGDDSAEDAAPVADGSPAGDAGSHDAAVVDCSGDHRESADSNNNPFASDNGSAEKTSLSLAAGGRGFWVCGQLDPAQATDQVADYDAYEFEVVGDEPVNLRIELVASDAGDSSLGLDLYRIDDGPPQQISSVPFRNGFALIAGIEADPGRYWVSAVAWPPVPPSPVGYAVLVSENQLSCPASEAMPIAEAGDGADSRGNDVVHIVLGDPPALTEADDAPEATGLTLEPDAVALLRGTSAAIPSDGDSYLDRDTYLVATGATSDELELRLTWPDDAGADLDFYLFAAGGPDKEYSVELGNLSGTRRDALMTLNVDPGQSYWLWVGALAPSEGTAATPVEVPYDVTLCPRAHVAPTPPR
ncbi:MAG TPA: hypothetical protein VKB80_03475 [Kofleriaceae bacterium]|nr:hypothetical protein [Kofleriaceae bacterium]